MSGEDNYLGGFLKLLFKQCFAKKLRLYRNFAANSTNRMNRFLKGLKGFKKKVKPFNF